VSDDRSVDRMVRDAVAGIAGPEAGANRALAQYAGALDAGDRAELAHSLYRLLILQKEVAGRAFLRMGVALKTIRDEELYRELDCETFDAFLADPKLSFGRAWAYRLISVAEMFTLKLGMTSERDEERLAAIGAEKLSLVTRRIKAGDDPETWLHEAEALGYSDLLERVRSNDPGFQTNEEAERAEDGIISARIADLIWTGLGSPASGPLVEVEYGRWSGLRLRIGSPTIKVWAQGGMTRVEIE